MRLWLDDIRKPPDGWTWAKTAQEAIALLETGNVVEASLDHDLAEEHYTGYTDPFGHMTGLEVARHIASMENPPEIVRVHSMNPVGAKAMRDVLGGHK